MPLAQLIDTSEARYQMPVGLIDDEVEHTPQGPRCQAEDTVTNDAFVVPERSWLYEAARRLREIRNLAPNWDSYGSPPLNEVVFGSAKEFLFSLHRDAPSPSVVPVSGGGVQFEWQINGRELEIEFCPDGRIEYLRVSEDETMDEGKIPSIKAMQSHALLTWLLEGQQTCDIS